MISPFIIGLIADRYFASEKILAVLGFLGGLLMCLLPQMTKFSQFYPMLILYCVTYVPTLALGNSLSLHHLVNPKVDFPQVKTLSSVGWIGGLVALNFLSSADSAFQFYLAGGASFLLGLYSLTLPHTPPKKTGSRVGEILGLDALALLKRPAFAVFIFSMFLICIPLYFYFVNLSPYLTELKWDHMLVKTSLAQVSDVVFFLILPLFLHKFGYKRTVLLGMACWVLRYFLLSQSVTAGASQAAFIFIAILVHGACYDFLFIAGMLYVDDQSSERVRGAAQGLIAFILWGVGGWFGTYLAGKIQGKYMIPMNTQGLTHDWSSIWQWPAWGSVVVMVFFFLTFHDRSKARLD
jgi:nucleoside transporter